MGLADTNIIIRDYLLTQTALVNLVGGATPRIDFPRLPDGELLPAIAFETVGGQSDPYVPGIVYPSVRFHCWADSTLVSRQVYRALFDALQGIQNIIVTISGVDYKIFSCMEVTQGIDMQDIDLPTYFRTIATFKFAIRAI